MPFFAEVGTASFLAGIVVAMPVVEFAHTGLVPRLPTAVLAAGLVLLAFLSFACGMTLDSVARGRKEIKRRAYLAIPSLPPR